MYLEFAIYKFQIPNLILIIFFLNKYILIDFKKDIF